MCHILVKTVTLDRPEHVSYSSSNFSMTPYSSIIKNDPLREEVEIAIDNGLLPVTIFERQQQRETNYNFTNCCLLNIASLHREKISPLVSKFLQQIKYP